MNGKEEGTEKKKTAGKKKKNNRGRLNPTKECRACGGRFGSRFFSNTQWNKDETRRCKNCVEQAEEGKKKKKPTVEELKEEIGALKEVVLALKSDHSALKGKVDALTKSIQGIQLSFEPATIFALLEFFVYERVKRRRQSMTDLHLYAVARVASRVLAELVTGSSSSAGPFSTITLTIKSELTSFTTSDWNDLAWSCLEGLNMFVGLDRVNTRVGLLTEILCVTTEHC